MDFTRRCAQLMFVLGTISLLIPGMNVVVTAGNADASIITNGSCHGTLVCRGGLPTLDPEILDFGPVIIGQVIVKNVRIRSYNRSLEVSKVLQSESSALYVQLKPKIVKKDLFVYKIRVALVPKLVGVFTGVITVFTSLGRLTIPVQAQIAPSPFRISPIEHPRIPLGSTFSRDILLYNPFGSALRILQIYLSGGPFHLTVPENVDKPVGQQIAPTDRDSWDIPAFQSRAVSSVIVDTARAFHERTFLRMIFNNTVFEDVILPIDATVVEETGLYSVDGVIDFGFIRLDSEPPSVPLRLRLSKPFFTRHIEEIGDVAEVPSVTTSVIQRSVSDSGGATLVANLTFFANISSVTGLFRGEILVKYGLEKLFVPYRVYIAAGGLSVAGNGDSWFMGLSPGIFTTATIEIRNDYPVPLVIVEAAVVADDDSCSDSEILKSNFPITVPPLGTTAVVVIRNRVKIRVPHTLTVALMTNVDSGFTKLPIRLYTGELMVDKSGINHWLYHGMSFNCNDTGTVFLRNINPTAVEVRQITLTSDCGPEIPLEIEVMSLCTSAGNCSSEFDVSRKNFEIESNSLLNISMRATHPKREGLCKSVLSLTTNFEVLTVRLDILVLSGRLELYEFPIVLENVFPSCFTDRNLTVFNTLDKHVDILNIFSEEFPGLKMMPPLDGVEISPETGLVFDTLGFDGRELCKDLPGLCYVGFDLESANIESEAWKRPFRMVTHSSVEIDRRMKERQLAAWNSLSEGSDSFPVTTSLKVTTKQSYIFHLPVTLNFIWPPPLVSSHESLQFPLLSVGNFSEMDVEVTNPTDKTLFVHAYVFRDDKATSWNRDIFFVKSIVPKGTTAGFYDVDDERLPAKIRLPTPFRGSAASMVPYAGQFLVRVVFQPQSEACYSGVLHIRNNLTVVESIPVRGCGVEPHIRFSNDATVPETPTLTVKFTGKDGAYCRNRTVDMADREKIKRMGKITIRNAVGAYITVESVTVVEDDWYHRSFALAKSFSPFLLAPNKTRKLPVDFNPDFGMAKKVAKVLVFVSDRAEPFVYEITGEVDSTATRLCRPIFGRSENDLYIQYLLFTRRWGCILYFLPLLFFGGYLGFFRSWYTKRLKKQFLRRYFTQLEQKLPKKPDGDSRTTAADRYSQKFLEPINGEIRRRGSKRRGNPRQDDALEDALVLSSLLQLTEQPVSLRESVEKQIPENLRELFCVAYFAEVPSTFFRNFRLPTRRLYRLFVLLEITAFPVRLILNVVAYLMCWIFRICGWSRFEKSHSAAPTVTSLDSSPSKKLVVAGVHWSVDSRKILNISPGSTDLKSCTKSQTDAIASLELPLTANTPAKTSVVRNGVLSKDPQSKDCPPVATVAPVKRPSVGSKQGNLTAPIPTLLAAGLKPSPASLSRDSSSCADDNVVDAGSGDEHQLDGNCPEEDPKSARKLRRARMHQAKLMAEKAAKLAKTYNKTQKKAEDRKAIEANKTLLAKEKSSLEASSDSETERMQRIEAERLQRIEADRRRAKMEAEKLAKKTARPTLASDKAITGAPYGHKSPDIFVPLQSRPPSYPVQTDVIQQAFFKVEPKENGLMFMEMNRDECLQLVKQLKRDHPNLFQLDPKAAVELLQLITRTSRYRLNGEFVDLARKSSVAAYSGSNRPKKDLERTSYLPDSQGLRKRHSNQYDLVSPPPVRPQTMSQQRPNDQRSPESTWSFSPTGSESGILDSRLSPMLSYANVAGQQQSQLAAPKSLDMAQADGSEPWKSPTGPSLETSRFLWDEPTSMGTFANGTFESCELDSDMSMLVDYQERQCRLVDYGDEARFRSDDRALFFTRPHELQHLFLSDMAPIDTAAGAWSDPLLGLGSATQSIWQENQLGFQEVADEYSTGKKEVLADGWPPGGATGDSQRNTWPSSIWSSSSFFGNGGVVKDQNASFFGAIGESLNANRRGDKF